MHHILVENKNREGGKGIDYHSLTLPPPKGGNHDKERNHHHITSMPKLGVISVEFSWIVGDKKGKVFGILQNIDVFFIIESLVAVQLKLRSPHSISCNKLSCIIKSSFDIKGTQPHNRSRSNRYANVCQIALDDSGKKKDATFLPATVIGATIAIKV